jgi:hypothetical protein
MTVGEALNVIKRAKFYFYHKALCEGQLCWFEELSQKEFTAFIRDGKCINRHWELAIYNFPCDFVFNNK